MSTPSTINGATEPPEPRLEWCDDCDRPLELCSCNRSTNRAPADQEPVADRSATTTPVTYRSAAPVEDSGQPVASTAKPVAIAGEPVASPVGQSRLGWRVGVAIAVIGALGVALGVVGFAMSFDTVAKMMKPEFGGKAFLVPLGTDLGIVVSSLGIVVLAVFNMRIWWLAVVPWGLTAATIYLNARSSDELIFQIAHMVLPVLFVVMAEVIAHVVRVRVGLASGTGDKAIPLWRWVLAPMSTFWLWRLIHISAIGSYREALADQERQVFARIALQSRWGRKWRKEAPAMLVARYRMRKIRDADVWAWQESSIARPGTEAKRPASDRSATGTGRTGAPSPKTGRPESATTDRPKDKTGRSAPVAKKTGRPAKTGDRPPAADRLAAAFAAFQTEGIDPSGAQLAERAECSKTVANDWKNNLKGGK